ncbi:MAG: LamG domain-containing protein [Planctomycetota bacterium]
MNDNLWHHVAGVYDGSKVYLYVDGLLDNSEYASGVIDSSSYNVWIGANEEAADREWNGLIDDVRIYDYGLSHAEIVNLTGASDVYQPVLSLANISDEEAKLSKTVNFKDYIVIANNWLEEKLWPWP